MLQVNMQLTVWVLASGECLQMCSFLNSGREPNRPHGHPTLHSPLQLIQQCTVGRIDIRIQGDFIAVQ